MRKILNMKTFKTLLNEMQNQKNLFVTVKAYFPYMNEDVIGQKELITAPYYQVRGHVIKLVFGHILTEEDVMKNNEISRWMNENYIVRLWALLSSYGIVKGEGSIDKTIECWEDVKLLIRLRNLFAHASGKYNPEDPDQKKLARDVAARYNLPSDNLTEIRLDIDTVIDPLYKGCRRYVQRKVLG